MTFQKWNTLKKERERERESLMAAVVEAKLHCNLPYATFYEMNGMHALVA